MTAVTTQSELCSAKPDYLDAITGLPRGHATGVGDWRFVVELMIGTGAVWGAFKWGTVDPDTGLMPKWGAGGWLDISDRIDGIQAFRGADEPNGRARVGDIQLTLRSEDDEFDPWVNYARVRPGTVMRAGFVSAVDTRAGGWLPRWTGVADDWPIEYVGTGAVARCNVTLAETAALIANHDENAVAAVGAGELIGPRVDRLLTAANWPFGIRTLHAAFTEPTTTLQATTMAGSRLAELYLSADSCSAIVRSDVTGAMLVTNDRAHQASRLVEFSFATLFGFDFPMLVLNKGDDGYNADLFGCAYVADSVQSANNRDGIVNDHRYARVGGAQQSVTNRVSIGRFRERIPRVRGDLICQTDPQALAAARHDSDLESRTALRIEGIDVEVGSDRPDALLCCAAADLLDSLWVFPPASVGFDGSAVGRIRSIEDLMIPSADGIEWVLTFAVDFYSFHDMPGVQLPPAS